MRTINNIIDKTRKGLVTLLVPALISIGTSGCTKKPNEIIEKASRAYLVNSSNNSKILVIPSLSNTYYFYKDENGDDIADTYGKKFYDLDANDKLVGEDVSKQKYSISNLATLYGAKIDTSEFK